MQLLDRLGRLLHLSSAATPARGGRRRPSFLSILPLLLPVAALATPPCSTPGSGWCLARRFPGTTKNGELGFRFGEPLDVWSGADGTMIVHWDGEWPDALFGHWTMPIPDVSGDGLADVVVAAPHARLDQQVHGVLVARSPKTGALLWKLQPATGDNLGWDLALAGDQNGDGATDLFVGAPADRTGVVHLVSGKDGTVLRTYAPEGDGTTFGWYVAAIDDLDGDRRDDLVVGGPSALDAGGARTGAAWVLSSATGTELRRWRGTDVLGGYGGVVTATGDVDGDGLHDLVVSTPLYRHDDAARTGRLEIRSGRDGSVLSEITGDAPDAWFGWHVRRAPDPDGQGRPTLLVSSLRHPADGTPGVGVLDLLVLRQGTITSGARRSDIK